MKNESLTEELLLTHKNSILKDWINELTTTGNINESNSSIFESQCGQFLDNLINVIKGGKYKNTENSEYKELLHFLNDLSRSQAIEGSTPKETAIYIFSLKDTLLKYLIDEHKNSGDALYNEIKRINSLLDNLGLYTIETFVQRKEKEIEEQRMEIIELSTPVLKVWDGILALPIIGTLDSIRAQQIMEGLLNSIVREGYEISIIDISGVPTVDTLTAHHIIKTVNAAKLMGAECIISGIRPEIAQTIVGLGIDLLGLTTTKSNMAEAMKHAYKLINKKVVEIN